MKLENLIRGLDGVAIEGPANREIAGVAYDSRQVRPGWLFAALPGARCDGASFAADAVARGAVAVLAERPLPGMKEATVVRVPGARAALARMAEIFYGLPAARLRLAGVTGTNGKTTAAFMARAILEGGGRPWGLLGTVEYRVGPRVIPATRTTPEAPDVQDYLAQMAHAGCEGAVLEVSSHALDQERVRGRDFDAAVFTNLTQDHLDYHVTMDAYFEAKKKLFADLGRGAKKSVALVNADDPWGRRLAAGGGIAAPILTYGRAADAAIRAESVELSMTGSRFRVATPWGMGEARLRLLGAFNVSNALAAIGLGGALGVPLELCLRRLEEMRTVPGRLETVPNRRGFLVFVDYAHTDDALANVLRTLREMTAGRLIAVFGCGGDRDRTKRPKMGAVASELADHTVLTSDNPRREKPEAILADIRAGMPAGASCDVEPDRTEAIRRALALARPGDVVLIAGKGHETFQEFANRSVPFDDRETARGMLA